MGCNKKEMISKRLQLLETKNVRVFGREDGKEKNEMKSGGDLLHASRCDTQYSARVDTIRE
jgi:hypothetical protein